MVAQKEAKLDELDPLEQKTRLVEYIEKYATRATVVFFTFLPRQHNY